MTGFNDYHGEMESTSCRFLTYRDWVKQYGGEVVTTPPFVSDALARLEFENEQDAVYFKLKCRT
jgi:hypothetical protein